MMLGSPWSETKRTRFLGLRCNDTTKRTPHTMRTFVDRMGVCMSPGRLRRRFFRRRNNWTVMPPQDKFPQAQEESRLRIPNQRGSDIQHNSAKHQYGENGPRGTNHPCYNDWPTAVLVGSTKATPPRRIETSNN